MGASTDPRGDQEIWDLQNGVPYIGLFRFDVVTNNSEIWWDGAPHTELLPDAILGDIYSTATGTSYVSDSIIITIRDLTCTINNASNTDLSLNGTSAFNRPNANKVFWDGASFDYLEKGKKDFGDNSVVGIGSDFSGALYPTSSQKSIITSGLESKKSKITGDSKTIIISAKISIMKRRY